MNIKVHSIHFDADRKLIDFIRTRINKLANFYEEIISAEVFLRLENTQSDENKVTEIRLMIPGNELFAKKQNKTFEEAADQSIEALRKQIGKHKAKMRRA